MIRSLYLLRQFASHLGKNIVMKTQFWAATAALSAMLVASAANAQTNGYVGVSYNDVNIGDNGLHNIAARAVGLFDLPKTVKLQLDGDISVLDAGTISFGSWGATAHVFADKGSFRGGAFLGYSELFSFGQTSYGVEGRVAVSESVSLGINAGRTSISIPYSSSSLQFTTLRGEASFFQNDNLRWDASVTSVKVGGVDTNITINTYELGGEYQMMKSPNSFTFGLRQTKHPEVDAYIYSVGVRRTFGGSLKVRDRSGAPFNNINDYSLLMYGG